MRTKEMSFDEWTDQLTEFRAKKILKHNDDQVYLVCGDEGTQKSTFSMASACEVYRKSGLKMREHNICFERRQWEDANLELGIKKLLDGPPHIVEGIVKEFGLDRAELQAVYDRCRFSEGDILVDDEGGTEAYARESMTGKNVEYIKTMIRNRFLNMMHFCNVPKPESMDPYIRRHRAKMLVWCDAVYTDDLEQRIRKIYIYPKQNYIRILYTYNWWTAFSSTSNLVKKFPPPFVINNLPDLRQFIPKDIHEYYHVKKAGYFVKNLLTARKDKEKNGIRPDSMGKVPLPGESKRDWMSRTKLSPASWKLYRGG